jgi:hypothetical protein
MRGLGWCSRLGAFTTRQAELNFNPECFVGNVPLPRAAVLLEVDDVILNQQAVRSAASETVA